MMCIAEEEEATWYFHDASDQEGVYFLKHYTKLAQPYFSVNVSIICNQLFEAVLILNSLSCVLCLIGHIQQSRSPLATLLLLSMFWMPPGVWWW